LGVVPIGTGNDFAKPVGLYGHAPVRAVQRLVTARPVAFDVGRVFDEYFVNSAGVGFGAEVVRVRNAMPGLSGFLSYLVPVFRAFARFRPPRLEVRASGFGETGYMMMVEICNGTTAGGSYRFAPAALPGDGRLDVCVVRRVSLPRFLLAVPRVMRGTHGTMREVARFRPPRLEVRASGFGETGYMMMVEICNGTTAGGSYRFAPAALPGDGRLDVCVVRRVSLPRFLLAVPRVMRGTHGTMREVALF